VDLDKHKIKPVENERFKDAHGKPLKKYEFIIIHVNNQKEQIWTGIKDCMSADTRAAKERVQSNEGD